VTRQSPEHSTTHEPTSWQRTVLPLPTATPHALVFRQVKSQPGPHNMPQRSVS
jgi:hypothetical protein